MHRTLRLGGFSGMGALALLPVTAAAADAAWDCRAGTDGRGWSCSQNGIPVVDTAPRPAARPAQAPLTEPAPTVAQPPVPATVSPAPVQSEKMPESARTPASDARAAASADKPAATPPPPAAPPESTNREAPANLAPAFASDPGPADHAASKAFEQDGQMPDLLAAPAQRVDTMPEADAPVAPAPAAPNETAPQQIAAQEPPPTEPGTDSVAAMAIAGGLDEGIDWQTCPTLAPTSPRVQTNLDLDTSAPIDVQADSAVAELDPQQTRFSGNVELVQGGLQIQADQVLLNRSSGEVDASGGFVLTRPDIRLAGDAAHYQLREGSGTVEGVRYRVPQIRARGEADQARFLGDGRNEFTNLSYSTCQPGSDDWLLTANTLELDHAEGLGTAKHATLRFAGVPLLYVPTFTFPIDDRRRSGVLVPSVGYSENTGVDISVPYYLNLAENYDLTLVPRLMSDRGLMLGGEFRFLTSTTEGQLRAEYLPHDSEYAGGDGARGSASFYSHTDFNLKTEADLRLNYASDSDYFEDLGNSLAVTSATHLERVGELRFHGDDWTLLGRVQHYQTIDDTIAAADRPYSRLPQIRYLLNKADGLYGSVYHLDAEYVNFHRSDSVRGHRVDLFPAISLPLRNANGYLEPKIGARYTAYRLRDQTPGLNDSPSTLSGLFSLDGGLAYDRGVDYFGTTSRQTLEPRFYYLLVPEKSQTDQPIFDTAALDFSFDNLFRENRFSGPDRFGDANRLTLALRSRVISEETGAELLRASIGQTLYFADRDVVLPGETLANDNSSTVAAELAARLGGGWRTRAGLQWNPHDGDNGSIEQALAQINYRDSQRRIFNAAYRLRDGVTQQTDLAAIWPVNERLSVIGRHNYSLKDNRLLEALAGVEYGKCCWRLRALVRQYTDSTGDDHNLAFLLQLELNGLGRLGTDIDSTLERGIYGYRNDDQD